MKLLSRWSIASALVASLVVSSGASVASASDPVDGAGSTWSQIAVDQWRADVARQGLVVNYQGVGSTAGRVAYYQAQVDFAVSEIPFQSAQYDRQGNLLADETQLAASRPYAYLPIVAGGTAFMYNLKANGQRVTDLKLSPTTAAKIFTGQITMWNDPLIAADNPQRVMPATRIKPVIRSDGSGTTAQFTAYMADETTADWNILCQRANLGSSCPATSLYPDFPNSGFAAQQFSDGVANFVAAQYNDGTQVLGGVYRNSDSRAYPISSYSYMIVPTTEAAPFNASKGQSLSEYIFYFLCAGQQKAEQLGYAPLPRNLVEFGFEAVARIPGAVAAPAIDSCANPTITGGFLVPKANTTATTAAPAGGTSGSAGSSGGSSGTTIPGATTVPGAIGEPESEDDVTTDQVIVDATGGEAVIATPGVAMATSIEIETEGSGTSPVIYLLIAVLILGIAVGPPIVAGRLRPSVKQ
ncbi:MAG: hypothetical protein RL726_669 [Actinomycetota bacterium]